MASAAMSRTTAAGILRLMPNYASTGFDIPGPGGAPVVSEGHEPPWVQNFDNPSYAWRRLFSEAFGTFLLVLVAVGGDVVGTVTGAPSSRAAAATAPALMVMVVILFMGRVSGAHLNPVVSMAFALRASSRGVAFPATLRHNLSAGLWHASSCGRCSAGPVCLGPPSRPPRSATRRRCLWRRF